MYIVTTVHGLHSINGRATSRRTQLVRVNLSLLRVACKTERGWHSLNMVLCDVRRQWACSLSQARVGARRAVVGDAATDTLSSWSAPHCTEHHGRPAPGSHIILGTAVVLLILVHTLGPLQHHGAAAHGRAAPRRRS
jgi:hypothetical protein